MTAVKVRLRFYIESVDPLNIPAVRIYCNGELALHTMIEKINTKKFNWSAMISIDMDEGKEYNFALFFSDTDAHDIKFKHLEINDNIVLPVFPVNYKPHLNLCNPINKTYKNILFDIDPTLYENHISAKFLGFDTPITSDSGKSVTLRLTDGEVQVLGYFKQPDKFKRIKNIVDKRAGNTQPINGYSSNLHWIVDYYEHIIEKGKYIDTNKKLESTYSIWLKLSKIKNFEGWLKENQNDVRQNFSAFVKQLEDKVDALALTKTVDIKWVTQTENDIADLEKLLEKNPSNEFAMAQLEKMQTSLSDLQNTMSGVYSSEHYPSVLLFDPNKNLEERMTVVTLKEEFELLRANEYAKVMGIWKDQGFLIYRIWEKGLFGHYKLNCPGCLAYWQDPSFDNEKEMTQRVVDILSRDSADYKIFLTMLNEMYLNFMYMAENAY